MYTSNNEFDVNRSELNVESDTWTEFGWYICILLLRKQLVLESIKFRIVNQ